MPGLDEQGKHIGGDLLGGLADARRANGRGIVVVEPPGPLHRPGCKDIEPFVDIYRLISA